MKSKINKFIEKYVKGLGGKVKSTTDGWFGMSDIEKFVLQEQIEDHIREIDEELMKAKDSNVKAELYKAKSLALQTLLNLIK